MKKLSFEEDAEQPIPKIQLKRIVDLASQQIAAEDRVAEIEGQLESAKKSLQRIQQEIFPSLMKEVGVTEFKLDSGEKIFIKHGISASVPPDQRERAFQWLRKNRFGSLIKTIVSARFGRGEEAKARALLQRLTKEKLDAEFSETIHSGTLSAFVREQMEKGKNLPSGIFSIFEWNQSQITRPKSSKGE